jgi:hypothetical protein
MANSNGAYTASDPDISPDAAQGGALANEATTQDHEAHKSKRTKGLRVFDALVYPVFNNTTVFITSVVATYLSINGGKMTAAGKPALGKAGLWFRDRSIGTDAFFQTKFGMGATAAKNFRIVLWSFIDGSLLSIPVKWLENVREPVAKKLDDMFGTRPADNTPYEAEPKQTWGSVLGGRTATAAIVVSTALAFEGIKHNGKTLNDKIFERPSEAIEGFVKRSPRLNSFFSRPSIAEKIDVKPLAYVSIFEAVYTSICTAGLYFSSRAFARKHDTKQAQAANSNVAPESLSAPKAEATPTSDTPPVAANRNEAPDTKLTSARYDATISQAPEKALAAV